MRQHIPNINLWKLDQYSSVKMWFIFFHAQLKFWLASLIFKILKVHSQVCDNFW